MKKTAKRVLCALLIACLVLTAAACGAKSDVNQLIDSFEAACVELDTSAMLDCMNPSVANPVRTVLDLLGVKDLDKILDALVDVIAFVDFKDDNPVDVLATLKIKPENHVFNDAEDECTVTASVTYTADGEEVTDVVSFKCILVDEVWYISRIS